MQDNTPSQPPPAAAPAAQKPAPVPAPEPSAPEVDFSQEITGKLKDGSYYQDAKEWYVRRYIVPITERSVMLIVSLLAATVFLITLYNIMAVLPMRLEIPFAIRSKDTVDHFSYMKPLDEDGEDPQTAVSQYVIKNYVKIREEYHYEDMQGENRKFRLKGIKNNSASDVYRDYRRSISATNPQSPLIRYRNVITRDIEATDIDFLGDDRVKIRFTATERDIVSRKETTSEWEADVMFRMPEVEDIAVTGAPFRFVVTSYRVRQIK